MLNDFRKSIQSVLYERVRSPFSGALFFSWIVWNWKLLYFLLFANVPIIPRIEYVEENYINPYNNLVYPLLSTIFLVSIYPFITTTAYWIWLKFKDWQTNIRDKIEMTQRIPLDKSIELRLQIRNQDEEFDKIIKQKNDEILLLKKQFEEYTISENQDIDSTKSAIIDIYFNEFNLFKKSHFFEYWDAIIDIIASQAGMQKINARVIAYYVSNDIIKHDKGHLYSFTEKGQKFVKYYLDPKEKK